MVCDVYGCDVCRVDQGSPSDESGLRVGDQIVDVNGHSFNSVFHQEAVHILRSYPTLIMTIKVHTHTFTPSHLHTPTHTESWQTTNVGC